MRVLETLSWTEIESALGARAVGNAVRSASGASIDTRSLEAGDIFFAFKGQQADGHDYLQTAFDKGAAAVVVQDLSRVPARAFALVAHNPEKALFELGRLIRSRTRIPFVAVTGSAGKTTAKEFIAELLTARGEVLATRGNLNNHLGVPLTLARLSTGDWAAVIECGMSRPGEISRLAHLLQPKVALITSVAAAHLEFFESVDQIAAAKAEIFETLSEGDTAIVPADEPRLTSRVPPDVRRVCRFGDDDRSTVRASAISMSLEGSSFELQHGAECICVALPVPGPHAVKNFLAAAAVALTLGLSIEDVARRAPRLRPGANRGTVRRLRDDIVLIDDTYNSNPLALLSAVETLALARDRRRVACIGDMLELGAQGPALHREAGAVIGTRVDLLLGVGPLARELVEGAVALPASAKKVFADSTELAGAIASFVVPHDAVLVKGSRGVRMERVVAALVSAHPGAAA